MLTIDNKSLESLTAAELAALEHGRAGVNRTRENDPLPDVESYVNYWLNESLLANLVEQSLGSRVSEVVERLKEVDHETREQALAAAEAALPAKVVPAEPAPVTR